MTHAPSLDQLRIERLMLLCQEVERSLRTAANTRTNAAEALNLLKYAEAQATRLCADVDKFLSLAPRLKQKSGQIRKRRHRRPGTEEA